MAKMKDRTTDAVFAEQDRFPIDKAMKLLNRNIKLQLKGSKQPVPTLMGRPGMGKTEHIKQLAESLNMEVLYYSMCKPYENFTGLPITNKLSFENDEEGRNSYVKWSQPEMIHEANELARHSDKNGCIIFLDDIHVMGPDVQKTFFELVLERQLGNHKLDKNVAMVAAMNSSSMAGFDGFFSAINNRLQKIGVYLPFEYWYKNCGASLNPLVAAYLRYFKDAVEEEESIDSPFATYRTWTMLSEQMDFIYEDFLNDRNVENLLYDSYMLAKTMVSGFNAQQFKGNISQQIKYDFEGMVKNNSFKIDPNDVISSLTFGNVLRYLRNGTDIDNLVKFIDNYVYTAKDVTVYQNAIINIMYELLAFTNMYRGKRDPESKKRLDFFLEIQEKIFAIDKHRKDDKIHDILASLNNVY